MYPSHSGLKVVESVPILLVGMGRFRHDVLVVLPSYACTLVVDRLPLVSIGRTSEVSQVQVSFGIVPWVVLR